MLIVCGTDFSGRSRGGLAAAAVLAPRFGATLRLVHVLDSTVAALPAPAYETIERGVRTQLEDEARWLADRSGVRVDPVLLVGAAAAALAGDADSAGADLIVVASQGRTGSPIWRIGGTAERLTQASRRPVLVVRDAAPFEAWASGRRLRVLLAVDWTGASDGAIRWVKSLREAGACDVVVGYVYASGSLGDGATRYGLESGRTMLEPDPETERLLARDLASRVGEVGGVGDLVFRPRHGIGRVGDTVLDLAESERADLIVVGTHFKRGLARLTSVAGVALHYGRSAVAVVPVRADAGPQHDRLPHLRRVLIPTDFSPLANQAIPYGYALVAASGGEVCLLHVDTEGSAEESEIVARLRALVPRVDAGRVATRTEVVRSRDAARAICEAGERLGVDVICIGSRGRSGLAQVVLGSVVERVLRESRNPVLVVRPAG